jgi:cytosine/adenosine deaminase-related metal-dependent hydrolase
MATLDGAKCYGLEKEVGSLEKGKRADIVILDGSTIPTPLTSESVIGHLLNSFSGRHVRDVFVNGDQVVRNGSLSKTTDDHVREVSRASAERLWSKL